MGYIRFIIYIYMDKYGLVWMDKSFPLGLDKWATVYILQ